MKSTGQPDMGKSTAYIYIQLIGCVMLAAGVAMMIYNINVNFNQHNISLDWAFLMQKSGFGISQKWLSHNSYQSNLNVLIVGVANTVIVSMFAIVLSTVLGVLVALCSRHSNPLIRGTGRVYIHIFRNVPLLVQILFWYNLWVLKAPVVKNTWINSIIAVNNRGVYLPEIDTAQDVMMWLLISWFAVIALLRLFQYKKVSSYHVKRYPIIPIISVTICVYALGISVWLWSSGQLISPSLGRFNVSGYHIYPEFIALLLGLGLYTAAYNAESIRGAIQGVSLGQQEAAEVLSMSPWQSFRHVILPQSIPGFLPPLTSHYVNCTKNSSLGLAVGYPEVFAIFAGTVLNQTGRAFEIIAIIMAVYTVLSLLIIVIMNWLNSKQARWTGGQVR